MLKTRFGYAISIPLVCAFVACSGAGAGGGSTETPPDPTSGGEDGGNPGQVGIDPIANPDGGNAISPRPSADDAGITLAGDAGPGALPIPADGGSACGPAIGNWTATLQPGATATGTLLLAIGGTAPLAGTITFALTATSMPTIVAFTGSSTISAAGIPVPITLQPGTTPCTVLHMTGKQTLPIVGVVDFTVDATFDETKTPIAGSGTFVVTSDGDNGKGLTAKGAIDLEHS